MAFTVEEFRDLIRILEERPEWRSELRRLVLTDELLTLPDLVRALGEHLAALAQAQQRGEEVNQEAMNLSVMLHVWQVTDGHAVSPFKTTPLTSLEPYGLARTRFSPSHICRVTNALSIKTPSHQSLKLRHPR